MLGGAFGAGARHLVGRLTLSWFGPNYPWGTLAVNLIGGFAMGLIASGLLRWGESGEQMRLLLGVGLLGGFTTFSAFSLETALMIERRAYGEAGLYVILSVGASVAALFAGMLLARRVFA